MSRRPSRPRAPRCERTSRREVCSLVKANAPQIDQALQALDPVRWPETLRVKGGIIGDLLAPPLEAVHPGRGLPAAGPTGRAGQFEWTSCFCFDEGAA